ncbi:cytochrome-c oxidase, cbb3-type subunit III [Mangrovicoccus algicola]|uniref:Cbb3-type cytochrome c oxidase subunit n=1 Tax=Mangrovicoccus algicola TaxID=2771008 RepID=A0A8J6YQ74_9RHOB|nr:cytochrome-c oxidase, cbb3-type subunit III [Mangrovicoccus algicola]MBE3637518.1 cytochrome-c oxidase, cbb3-type subunit III [Mangrovicoccus algicola]
MSSQPGKSHDGAQRDQEVPTTGHSWDGIEEYDNPMPRWWLTIFYITLIWGAVYSILMPSWPGVTGAWPGLLGWSTRGEVAEEVARMTEANAEIDARLAAADLTALSGDPELSQYAVNAGAAVFRTWCAQCHGSGAAGATGFPNLLDDDWLWGGDIASIAYTVTHGIRNETDADARYSQMPVFDELLEPGQIDALANYVLSLSGTPPDSALAAQGAALFADNCVACHMEDGTGNPEIGAPNLADAIWLYGGDYDTVRQSIAGARFGVMPNWNTRLTQSQINAVATYVHALGGGE